MARSSAPPDHGEGGLTVRTSRANMRIMRATRAIDALFPAVRQAVLSVVLLQPDREWYFRDLAKHLRLSPSSLTRELSKLTQAGILRRRAEGNRVYYRAEPDCPFLPELRGLLIKTAGLADVLRESLRKHVKQIAVALIYGSVAKGEELSRSDVDLLVVGSVGLAELAQALRPAEKRLLRPVNPVLYSEDEFRQKIRERNHLVSAILKQDVILLVGDADDLERLGQAESTPRSRHKQAGA